MTLVADEYDRKLSRGDEELGKALKRLNAIKLDEDIASLKLTTATKCTSASIFNVKGRILGQKKNEEEKAAIEDPESGLLLTDPNKIKEATAKYCANILKNRDPSPGYEHIIDTKNKLHLERMKEKIDDDLDEMSKNLF